VRLVELIKNFGDHRAVDKVDLDVRSGEFFSLLGPSGCGKTTTLRMIAGFETPDEGQILLDGQDVVAVSPHKRNVHTVFQSYALFPHMNVFDNVAFGLRRAKAGKAEIRTRVHQALEMVQLSKLAKRRPLAMSGGQQQRVALARALVCRPAVLLLDEPLGALDAKLRKDLQIELKTLQESVGITFIYVTHDQDEALTMSDRVGVMNDGRLEQVATPAEIYDRPTTTFVADFLGAANLMPVTSSAELAARSAVMLDDRELLVDGHPGDQHTDHLAIRPERVVLEHPGEAGVANRVPGRVVRSVFHGAAIQVYVALSTGKVLNALVQNVGATDAWRPGDEVIAHLPADALRLVGRSPSGDSTGQEGSLESVS